MAVSSYKAKQMIVMRRDLKMRKGKIAAQVYLDDEATEATALSDWFDAGVAKVCVYVDSEEELLDLAARGRELGFVYALVRDAGLTEFHGESTFTCLAFEPLRASQIDPLTGDLPLY